MSHDLDFEGYRRTTKKLHGLRARLAAIDSRDDIGSIHQHEAKRSYRDMISQLEAEVASFEASHPIGLTPLEETSRKP